MADVMLTTVNKWYGDFHAVKDVDLQVGDREFMVLLGPSGSGKTTVLRMIAGLEEVSGGEIAIGGRRVNELPPRARDIAMVFQNYALFAHMSVYDNLAFGLRMSKTPKAETEQRVQEVARLLGLSDWLRAKPRHLSGGMQQRVALGRAIARDAPLFLMDEPLSNLDALLRVQTRTEIIKLARSLQTTVVYVTHDQVEAMTMAHRIAVMRGGVLQQVGTPLEVYNRPANRFVAGFIGIAQMTFFEAAELTAVDGGLVVRTPAFQIPLPRAMAASVGGQGNVTGRSVVLGIRPEDIRLADPGTAGAVDATVDVVEPLGPHSLVFVRSNELAFSLYVDPARDVRIGQRVRVAIDAHKIHLFDTATGASLLAGLAARLYPVPVD